MPANPLPLDAAARDFTPISADEAQSFLAHARKDFTSEENELGYVPVQPCDLERLSLTILALLAAVERGAEDTEKLRAENVNLWQIIRQKDRETYAAANSLDVAELDAMCCNLAIENAELREQVKRASHAATFMVE